MIGHASMKSKPLMLIWVKHSKWFRGDEAVLLLQHLANPALNWDAQSVLNLGDRSTCPITQWEWPGQLRSPRVIPDGRNEIVLIVYNSRSVST